MTIFVKTKEIMKIKRAEYENLIKRNVSIINDFNELHTKWVLAESQADLIATANNELKKELIHSEGLLGLSNIELIKANAKIKELEGVKSYEIPKKYRGKSFLICSVEIPNPLEDVKKFIKEDDEQKDSIDECHHKKKGG